LSQDNYCKQNKICRGEDTSNINLFHVLNGSVRRGHT